MPEPIVDISIIVNCLQHPLFNADSGHPFRRWKKAINPDSDAVHSIWPDGRDCALHLRSRDGELAACCGDDDLSSRRRESVTGGQLAPNSWIEAHITALQTSWSRNMSTKHLLTISLLLPLVAISATAQAGSTITDKSYWPNEARRSAPIRAGSQTGAYSAFAYDRAGSPRQPAANAGGSAWQYHGGPKGR